MKRFLLSFTILSLICTFSIAQNTNDDLLQKLVEKNVLSQKEADDLSKGTSDGKSGKIRDAFNTPYMKFGGYGLLWYRYNEYAEAHHTTDVRVIFLSMAGQVNNFKYFVLADFVNPSVHEFWGEWNASESFTIRGGQMKVPYSLENQLSLTDIETITNTRSVSSLIGMGDDVQKIANGRNSGGRDIGVMAYGKFLEKDGHELLQYSLGGFQGTGINLSENNKHKDFAASLYVLPIKNLRVGGSAYFGEAVYNKGTELTANSHVRNRWLISSDYKSANFYARAEWLHGNDGGIKKEGLYGTAVYYLLPQKLNIAGKVDYFNNNKDTNSEVIDYTIGANYYFYKNCRFQLNYTYSDYNNKWDERDKNTVMAQMQIVF